MTRSSAHRTLRADFACREHTDGSAGGCDIVVLIANTSGSRFRPGAGFQRMRISECSHARERPEAVQVVDLQFYILLINGHSVLTITGVQKQSEAAIFFSS